MGGNEWLTQRFEENRDHLRAVAYRMLGSHSEVDDALQDAWLRVNRSDAEQVENLRGWLTTIVARICLNMLRTRRTRRELSLDSHVPDPVVRTHAGPQPEDDALLADSVGLALLVVLDTLTPAERLAFVLHDMFDLPFDEVASMMERTPAATRQLASRARRRVKGAAAARPDPDLARQRAVVDAFFTAARRGDLDALVELLHPDVVLRIDGGVSYAGASRALHGRDAVSRQVGSGLRPLLSRDDMELRPAVVNGSAGVLAVRRGRLVTVVGFTIVDGRIVEMDAVSDPERIRTLSP